MGINSKKGIETNVGQCEVKWSEHRYVDKKYFGYHYRGERLSQELLLSEKFFLKYCAVITELFKKQNSPAKLAKA